MSNEGVRELCGTQPGTVRMLMLHRLPPLRVRVLQPAMAPGKAACNRKPYVKRVIGMICSLNVRRRVYKVSKVARRIGVMSRRLLSEPRAALCVV